MVNLDQFAIIVIYFLPHSEGVFKLSISVIDHFFVKDLPSPLASRAPNPVAPVAIRQVLPMSPVSFIPRAQLAHALLSKPQRQVFAQGISGMGRDASFCPFTASAPFA
jgi:hypothetical protein